MKKLVLPDRVYDQLADDSLIRRSHEPARASKHRAWLQEITDNVNRRLRGLPPIRRVLKDL